MWVVDFRKVHGYVKIPMKYWLLAIAAVFFVVPVLRLLWFFAQLVTFKLGPKKLFLNAILQRQRAEPQDFFIKILFALSQWEYFTLTIRFYVVGLSLTVWLVALLILGFWQGRVVDLTNGFHLALAALVVLNFVNQAHWFKSELKICEFSRRFPNLHPSVFFWAYKLEVAFGSLDLFSTLTLPTLMVAEADFREKDHQTRLKFWVLWQGLIDTAYLAHLILTASCRVGTHYATEVFDSLSCQWGKRMLQHTSSHFVVQGSEKLQGLEGRNLIICNHKSMLDFVLTFFALSETRFQTRYFRPRFIVAKDHFKDNPIIYHLLSLGRTIKAMGMVFIERKNRAQSFSNLREAARALVFKDIDVTVYPQGTRARGNQDRVGKRRDAGYYTTLSKKHPLGVRSHLKKGSGYLIFDALMELHRLSSPLTLNLIFVGIHGTATTLPGGQLRIQTGNTIEFHIGDVVSLEASSFAKELQATTPEQHKILKEQFSDKMNALIDKKLKETLGLHESLKKRYLTDLKGHFMFESEKLTQITKSLDEVETQTDIGYKILDQIYALPTAEWNGYLSQLSQILLGKLDIQRFQALLEQTSGRLTAI